MALKKFKNFHIWSRVMYFLMILYCAKLESQTLKTLAKYLLPVIIAMQLEVK